MSAPLPPVPNAQMFDDKGQMVPTWRGFFDKWRAVLNQIYDSVQGHTSDISSLDSLLGAVKPMPDGDIVGTTDTQTVTNKTISDSTIDSSNAIDLGAGITVTQPDVTWLVTSHSYTAPSQYWTLSDTEKTSLALIIPTAFIGSFIWAPDEPNRVYLVTNNGANDVKVDIDPGTTGDVTVTAGTSMFIYHNGTQYAALTGAF